MKLNLLIDEATGSSSFQPGEKVKARVEIHGICLDKSPHVLVVFRGRLKLWALANIFPVRVTKTLFLQSKQLVLECDQPEVLSASFEFNFPLSHPCCTREIACQLPPSLDIAASGFRVKTEYTITATVKPRGTFRIGRRVKRALTLCSMPPINVLPASSTSSIASLPAEKLLLASQDQTPDPVPYGMRSNLPPYSPAFQMELLIAQPPIVSESRPTPAHIVFHTPLELMLGESIYVHSLAMRLRSTISGSIGFLDRQVVIVSQFWSVQGLLRLDKEHFELDPGAWGAHPLLNTHPTCDSCAVQMRQSIEVTAGVTRGLISPIQYLQASLDVIVADPPPAYEERIS